MVVPWLFTDDLLGGVPTDRLVVVEEALLFDVVEPLFTVLRCVEELFFTAPSDDDTTVLRLLPATEFGPDERDAEVCDMLLLLP